MRQESKSPGKANRPGESEFDYESCAREPIRTPGSIQPFGYLLVLDQGLSQFTHCSQNLLDHLGVKASDFFSITPSSLLGEELCEKIDRDLRNGAATSKSSLKLQMRDGQFEFSLLSRRSDSSITLELEKVSGNDSDQTDFDTFEAALASLQEQRSLQAIVDTAAERMRELSGFDRVMVYKFDAEWNGQVIAEEKLESLDPYLGLNYPATDIPPQARALYEKNLVRILVDAQAEPSPIIENSNLSGGQPIDLGMTAIRSMSPIHIEYLENMGVRCTLTISLLIEGRLWGLIACHHQEPRHVGPDERASYQLLSRFLSNQIASASAEETSVLLEDLQSQSSAFFEKLTSSNNVEESLAKGQNTLLDFIKCDGAAILRGNAYTPLGLTFSEGKVRELVKRASFPAESGIFATDSLKANFPELEKDFGEIAGIVIAPITSNRDQCLIWFRREKSQTVAWGGDPGGNATPGQGNERFSPRKSFERWVEKVEGKSDPWTEIELHGISRLKMLITQLFAKQSLELERLNRKISLANEGLESFSYSVSHDLQSPIRRIKNYIDMLQLDEASPEQKEAYRRIDSIADEMSGLIKDLLGFSRVGTLEEWRVQPLDLGRLVDESFAEQLIEYPGSQAEYCRGDLPTAPGDRTLLRQLFSNLFSNALKYTSQTPKPQITLSAQAKDECWEFCLSDNGVGFDPQHKDELFTVFQRFHNRKEFPGSGIGLAISKRIVEAHHGEIWANSIPRKGAEFYFTLPHSNP